MNYRPLSDADLLQVFERSEKPASEWRVGLEVERFGFTLEGHPLPYEGQTSVTSLLQWLQKERGWEPHSEVPGGPILALERGTASVTLEPGGQVELSGAPHSTVHAVAEEYQAHLAELRAAGDAIGAWFAHVGFHPTARLEQLTWVPKRRYPIMREYLPTRGARGRDMMQRTATVQVNLDYASEADAMHKLLVLSRLTPLIQALTINAPFIEGRRSALKSERLDVWLNMDPARSGLLLDLWKKPTPRYSDYVEWALDAGMFLFVRDGEVMRNTGQTFRDFRANGFQGHHATEEDWRLHLGTLFPEVRLKSTLEIRCCDCVPPPLTYAVPALLVGLAYDAEALDKASAIADRIDAKAAVALQRQVAERGLNAKLDGVLLQQLCVELIEFAQAGLVRRARRDGHGHDEAVYLEPLMALATKGLSPADLVIAEVATAKQSDASSNLLGALRAAWDEAAPVGPQGGQR